MPTGSSAERSRRSEALVDSSVAIPLVVADHEHHRSVTVALRGRRLGLAGHAAFETYSVLTRLPPPVRRTPAAVERLLSTSFPATRFLDADGTASLFRQLASAGVSGGSVSDALVGAVAVAHGVSLVTRDTRALETYRALDVPFELIR